MTPAEQQARIAARIARVRAVNDVIVERARFEAATLEKLGLRRVRPPQTGKRKANRMGAIS